MNPFRLRTYETTPPDCYVYNQVSGIPRSFGREPEIMVIARQVSEFRKRNNLPRSSIIESLENVDRQTCWRLKNSPQWCIEDPTPFAPSNTDPNNPIVNPPCAGCGAPV